MNTNFVFTVEAQRSHQILLNCLEVGIPVYLEGPTGASKSFSSEFLCKLSGRKLTHFNINRETRLEYLAGQYDVDSISKRRIFHSKGPFIVAFEEGHTLLLEEIQFAEKECLQFIEDSLDSGIISVELPGMPLREIQRHENFRLIVTQIPNEGGFCYNHLLDDKFLSRFQVICFPGFTRHELFEIAQDIATNINAKFPLKLIDILIDFHIKWSKRINRDDFQCFTVREIIATIRALANNEDAYETIMTIYGARYKEDKKEELRKLLLCYYNFNNLDQKQFLCPKEFPNCFKNDNLLYALKSVLFSFRNKRHVILLSDNGVGVTQLARWISQYFDKIHASGYFFTCNEETKCSDLFGKQIILETINSNNEYIKWKSGFLTKAIKKGRVAVLDNISEVTEKVTKRLKCLLDQKYDDKVKYFDVPENPKKPQVEINENFRLLCTCKIDYISHMSKSFINRFDVIVLENQLKNITPTNLKKLIKFLLQTTNFTNQTNNQSGKKVQFDEEEIETTEISKEQKQQEDIIVEQFKPTDNQINLVYSNIDTSMTMSQIAKLCHAVAKYIKFFEGNFEEELIVHFTKDMLETDKDFSFKGKYEKLQAFLLSHLQPEEENDDDEFFYQNSPILCEFIAKLFAASIINLPVCIFGPTGVGKKSAIKKFARIRPCYSKSKFQMYSFHPASKPKHFYGTTTIKDKKIHVINGPLTKALVHGDIFIADDMNLSNISTMKSLSAVLEPCIGQKIYIPYVNEEVTINSKFFFIVCQDEIGALGRNVIPSSIASRFRYFNYPKQEVADISFICYNISQSFYKRRGVNPSFTKEQAMKVGEYMISLNDQRIIPKWSFNDVKKFFQRIYFQDTHPDKFINIKIYHNILFYTMSPINKKGEKDILPIVINLIGKIFGLQKLELQKLQKCIDDLPRVSTSKIGTYIMKGECGVIYDELSKNSFELKIPSFLNGLFMISLCDYSEPILLIGPSGFKTFLSEYFLKEARVISLNQGSTITQLFGSLIYLTDSEAKVFYLKQICKICRIENKYLEFSEKMRENQLKKEDITDFINFFQLPPSFQNVIYSLIDKLFNYGKVKENKNGISNNITKEYKPGFLLSSILQKKSLILKNLSNLQPNVLETLIEFFLGKNNFTHNEDINNTYINITLKELANFNSNIRVFATCNSDLKYRLFEHVLSRFSIIYIPSYKTEEQEFALNNYISLKKLSFDSSLIHLIIDFSQSILNKLSKSFTFIQMINIVEMCANLNKNNIDQLFNLSIVLYRLTLGQLARIKSNHNKLLEIFTELQFPLPEQIKSLKEQNPLVVTHQNGKLVVKSNITDYFINLSKSIDDSHNQQSNISFNVSFSEMLDVLHLGLVAKTPVIFEGASGQGKQTAINYIANLLGYNVINIIISNETKVEDLLGKVTINQVSQNVPHIEITKTKLVKAFSSNSDSIIVFHNINEASPFIFEVLKTIFDRNIKKIQLPNGSTILKGHLNLIGIYNPIAMCRYELPSSLIYSSLYHIIKNPKSSYILSKNTNYEDILVTTRIFNEKDKKIDNPEMDLTINLNSQAPSLKMESYIDYCKELYSTILEFLEESDESNLCFEKLCENMKIIEGDRNEMMQFLLMIRAISDHHHRGGNFIKKVKEILHHYKEQIKRTLSNNEIFHIFENNKIIFHFLLKNDIITISEDICNYLLYKTEPNGNCYCHFFYPELEKMKGKEQMKSIKNELLSQNPTMFEDFEEKRQEGENDSYICSLIRNDSVENFISFINRKNIPLDSEITPSIFETNSFLINNKNTTLIEYSAFFGSIQIFRYLLMNNVQLTPSLWLYSIHSKNAELIHILESNKIDPPKYMINNSYEDNSYLSCFIESIKCHHNDFSEYIEINLLDQKKTKEEKTKEIIILNVIKYHNYSYFQTDMIAKQRFFSLCFCNYNKIVDLYMKEKEKEIENKIILISNIQIK